MRYTTYSKFVPGLADTVNIQGLLDQLADGGQLIIPVGGMEGQMLERCTRRGQDIDCDRIAPVAFVPLVGEYGWQADLRPED